MEKPRRSRNIEKIKSCDTGRVKDPPFLQIPCVIAPEWSVADGSLPLLDGDMKLTRASHYALQAVAYMAARPAEIPTASHIIAKERGISEKFLLKVLKPLVAARVLRSIKGPRGGYRLARPANEISMLDVVEAIEGPIRGVVPGENTRGAVGRRIETVCRQSAEQQRKHLEKVKLSELTGHE